MSTLQIGDTVRLVQSLGQPTTADHGTPSHQAHFRIERIDEAQGVAAIVPIDGTTTDIQEVSLESLQRISD